MERAASAPRPRFPLPPPGGHLQGGTAPALPVAMVSGDHVGARAGAGRRAGGGAAAAGEGAGGAGDAANPPGLRLLCRCRRTEQPRRGPSAPRSQPVAPGALARGPRSPRPDRGKGARAAPRRAQAA